MLRNKTSLIQYFCLGSALFILVFAGCSTKKNTAVTRTYHNVTSRFNILFNGKESYKAGVKKIEDAFKNDYSKLLPVFMFTDEELNKSASGDMERTLRKTTKLVNMHSITVKPELKNNKPLDANEKAFYDQKEFNKYVDDTYLLMGKAHFYNSDYKLAKETFRFIMRDFPTSDIIVEAKIWLARTLIQNNEFRDANLVLSDIEYEAGLKSDEKAMLYTTLADYQLRLENYEKGTLYLNKALEYRHKKIYRIRYHYLLAQLNTKLGKYHKASELYTEVIKMNPPYEYVFNARINRALVYQATSGHSGHIREELMKMMKDDKNIDYLDQIYFALAEIEMKLGNTNQAIEYYTKSIQASTGNLDQKARSFLTLAELYYKKQDYLNSQAYYDSVVNVIDNTYDNYSIIFARANSLSKLANNLQTYLLQDSVQKIAQLPRNQINALIDRIIENVKAEEQRQKMLELQRREEQAMQQQMALDANIRIDEQGSSWYFYNNTTKANGKRQFVARWGNRKLEDNWRRKNKTDMSFDDMLTMEEDSLVDEDYKSEMNNKSREYYLIDIPFTDSMMQASHNKIQRALFNMGMIYRLDLQDYDNAITSFEELLRRYPGSSYEVSTYYTLYDIYKEISNELMTNAYKSRIIAEYPNSRFALILTDPDYASKLAQEENKASYLYNQAIEAYITGNYNQAIQLAQQGIKTYPQHALSPYYKFLHAMCKGYLGSKPALKAELESLTKEYPEHEISKQAIEVLAAFNNESIELTEEEEVAVEEEVTYVSVRERELHYCLLVCSATENINQMVFNVVNFNLDNYERQNFKADFVEFNTDYNFINIQRFKTKKESINYLNSLMTNEQVFRDVDKDNIQGVAISIKNYQLLQQTKSINTYFKFYENNY